MTGTLINAAAVIAGSLLGLLIKKGIPERIVDSLQAAMGLAVCMVGVSGVLTNMITVGADGRLTSDGALMLIISLVIGTVIGELVKLDDRINSAGMKLEKRLGVEGFSKGLIFAAMLYCVGAMSIVGSINDGLLGDPSVLIIKSTLDGIMSIILTATLGIGVMFSAIPVLIYQGSISLFAGALKNMFTADLITQLSVVGFALVICIGINLMKIGKIKTVNMLPSLLVPILYSLLMMLINLWR